MRQSGFSSAAVVSKIERALLIGLEFPKDETPLAVSLPELQRLAETAGAVVVGQLTQKRPRPDPAFFIGSGKIEEIKALAAAKQATLIIFDHELSPAQERNLEEATNLKVVDRTELILDIFAQHARSREGKLQVELAQNSFQLTRLSGHGASMSRLGGGIATRGPGETKLEYDRRHIRAKISQLKKEIDKLAAERERNRENRRRSQVLTAALVGYTNSGKSTLLNALTDAGVLTQDKLFATLDPTTRRLYLPSGKVVLLTDTVGLIQKLPHSLVAAFRATLEEISGADLLIHVVDIANVDHEQQISAVYQVLEELNSIAKPLITVFNKLDRSGVKLAKNILKKYQPAVALSALQRTGLDKLLATIDARLPALSA